MLKPHFTTENQNFDLETLIRNTKIDDIIKVIKDDYTSAWKQQIANSTKLSFYHTFKKEFKLEHYLTNIKNPSQRRIFTQFRLSNHKLQIEYGRYQNIPRNERLCKNCDNNTVEDEYHFAFECQNYQTLRNNSNSILQNIFQTQITTDAKRALLSHVMSSNDPVLTNLFSKHINDCFTTRDKSLQQNITSMRL